MITLTKEQTLEVILSNKKQEAIQERFKYTSKTKWKCLNCGCTIFVSYKQYSRNCIFCETCLPKFVNKPTIAQYHYMMRLKQSQLEIIESQTEHIHKNLGF